jgi:hypothetical protein
LTRRVGNRVSAEQSGGHRFHTVAAWHGKTSPAIAQAELEVVRRPADDARVPGVGMNASFARKRPEAVIASVSVASRSPQGRLVKEA